MMSISYDIGSFENVFGRAEAALQDIHGRAAAALHAEAEAIMADSKEHHVPVDEGTLRASGHVQEPTIRESAGGGRLLEVTMAFGGAAAPYAGVVHENPHARHPVGSWKYLEIPYLAAAKDLIARLRDRVRRG